MAKDTISQYICIQGAQWIRKNLGAKGVTQRGHTALASTLYIVKIFNLKMVKI